MNAPLPGGRIRIPAALGFFASLLATNVAPAHAAQVDDAAAVAIARPQEQFVDRSISPSALGALTRPVDAFYGFWNNGSSALLSRAIASDFTDHTLPPGRPQGPSGPATAAKAFLGAVPDMRVIVVQRLIVADRVVSHLHCTGHFTGELQGHRGAGQPIDFIATDVLRVRNDRITDNWHLEDNLTFLRQAGLLPR